MNINGGNYRIVIAQPDALSTVPIKGGEHLLICEPGVTLMFDGHAHIQSNNCCPLPLQWAIAAGVVDDKIAKYTGIQTDNVANLTGRQRKSRKDLADLTAGRLASLFAGRFGKIGRLATFLIGRMLNGKLRDQDMTREASWIVMSEDEWVALERKLGRNGAKREAGKRAQLTRLGTKTQSDFEKNFAEKCRETIGLREILAPAILLCMDLSYAHYWGSYGMPIYLGGMDGNDADTFFCNDFIAVSALHTHTATRVIIINDGVYTPKLKEGEILYADGHTGMSVSIDTYHLHARFLRDEAKNGGGVYFYTEQYDRSRTVAAGGRPSTIPFIAFRQNDLTKTCAGKEYVHFLDVAPMEDKVRFEDYQTQLARTEAAAIESPLRVFPFYHYDPRRHYDEKEKSPSSIAKSILDKHAFFRYQNDPKRKITYADGEVQGAMEAWADEKLNDPKWLEIVIDRVAMSNAAALEKIYLHKSSKQGLFWGVKMYPRLGYAPDDFARYPHLGNFYKECEGSGIPITFHCSPGGMSIADYHNFRRYDKTQSLVQYDIAESEKFFDGTLPGTQSYHSPARWRKVLEKYNKLKICMAHFGGCDLWKEAAIDEKPDTKGRKGTEVLFDEWVRGAATLCRDYENAYTDISYFVNPDPGLWANERDRTAELLGSLIKEFPVLKDRIIMGSDWYMIENDGFEGVGDYFRRMLEFLTAVGKNAGFDAWKMFSLVNPLRYLGLIDGKKGGTGPFEIDIEKLEKFAERFEGVADSKNKTWRDLTAYKEPLGGLGWVIQGALSKYRLCKTIKL